LKSHAEAEKGEEEEGQAPKKRKKSFQNPRRSAESQTGPDEAG